MITVVVILLVFSGFNSFMNSLSYQAQPWAIQESMVPTGKDEKRTLVFGNVIAFEPKDSKTGIIFYPGGLVDERAYMLLADKLSEQGITFIICSMPYDLAVLNSNKANKVLESYPEIEHWYMAGHSLGGAMAGSYLKKNADRFEGLILLAAYSTSDLSDKNLKVLSLYGSNDQVMNRDKYEKCFDHLPNATEIIIEGGNHAGFGFYGQQKGDGVATISKQQQLEKTVEAIVNFVNQ